MNSDGIFVLCVDVGGPKKIGWADDRGFSGSGADLGAALDRLAAHLRGGGRAALGFEAPIWTPRRDDLDRITGSRGGVEKAFNRAWSAGAGTGALGAALALMPWCLTRIAKAAGPIGASVDPERFREQGGLFLWEAFVSGTMKVAGTSHHDDASLACEAFVRRWPHLISDLAGEESINQAVSSALTPRVMVDLGELSRHALVIAGAPPATGRGNVKVRHRLLSHLVGWLGLGRIFDEELLTG